MYKVNEAYRATCIVLVLFILALFFSMTALWNRTVKTEELLEDTQNALASATEDSLLKSTELDKLNIKLEYAAEQLNTANQTISDLKESRYDLVYMGNFKLTHYCAEEYEHICGTGTGLTATGTEVTVGRTVAVDPSIIPYGTQIYIEGYGWFVAEDCGGAVKNKQIDIAVETHADALFMGVKHGGVWILVDK